MMTNDLKTFEIVPEMMVRLNSKLAQLSKKAVKLGLNPIVLNIVGEKFVEVPALDEEGDVIANSFTLEKRILVTVTGETPKLNGWSFLAVIEHHEVGNIIRFCPPYSDGVVDISRFRASERVCEQCGLDRQRKDTYIVRNDDGRIAQVGRNCLKDFTGHANPEALAEWAQVLSMLNDVVESFGFGTGHGERYFELSTVLEVSACVIRFRGFTSRKASMENLSLTPTSQRVMDIINPPKKETEAARRERESYVIEDRDKTLAALALAWAGETSIESDNDYLWNLRVVAGMEMITIKQVGLAVSMISAYSREMDKIARRIEAAKNRPVSVFVGTIGKRENFVVTLGKIVVTDGGAYGPSYIHLFTDANGNRLTWFASNRSNLEEGSGYVIKGTVKKHDIYRDENITILNRVAMISEIPVEPELTSEVA